MVAGEQSEQVDDEFVDNTLELDDIPQIVLPFQDDLSDNLKNLIRALVINQQNIINNSSFLFDRINELTTVLKRLAPPAEQPPPPATLESIDEE